MNRLLFFSSMFLLSFGLNLPAIAQEITSIASVDKTVLIARADRVYLTEDEDGNPCLEDKYGNRVSLREDKDGTYFKDEDGNRVYLEEDDDGDTYFEDEDGDRVYVEEDKDFGRSSIDRDRNIEVEENEDGRDIYIETR
ncbi:MAG: hypothetical protein IGR93_15150 [Hydrococcus sp. C42_A2020_068]|nr:hypothetical protein [Hydrococcus sp. C42_A2020_068]